MSFAVPVSALAGFCFGVLQSLFVGLRVKGWAGGTGLLWGFIVAASSAVAAIWMEWYGVLFAFALAIFILAVSMVQIARGR